LTTVKAGLDPAILAAARVTDACNNPATLSMTFPANYSPRAARGGDKVTRRVIADRRFREAGGAMSR
jgi:predicted membrane GTPase involved in stress response